MKIDLKIYVHQQVKHLQSGQYFPKAIDIKQRRGSMPSLCTCTLQRGWSWYARQNGANVSGRAITSFKILMLLRGFIQNEQLAKWETKWELNDSC